MRGNGVVGPFAEEEPYRTYELVALEECRRGSVPVSSSTGIQKGRALRLLPFSVYARPRQR
jgi:hypothetical protein